jgi:hypothetical protein
MHAGAILGCSDLVRCIPKPALWGALDGDERHTTPGNAEWIETLCPPPPLAGVSHVVTAGRR